MESYRDARESYRDGILQRWQWNPTEMESYIDGILLRYKGNGILQRC